MCAKVWGEVAPHQLTIHVMVLDQLLVTGQVSCCTVEGGATVCLVASNLVVRVATQ